MSFAVGEYKEVLLECLDKRPFVRLDGKENLVSLTSGIFLATFPKDSFEVRIPSIKKVNFKATAEICYFDKGRSVDASLDYIETVGIVRSFLTRTKKIHKVDKLPRMQFSPLDYLATKLEIIGTVADEFQSLIILDSIKRFFEKAQTAREQIRAFAMLFFHESLVNNESEKRAINAARIEYFERLPVDFKEDIKFSIWNMFGRPNTLGSDFGKEKFQELIDSPEIKRAVLVAVFTPRITALSLDESHLDLINRIELAVNNFSQSLPERGKLHIFQLTELLAKMESPPITTLSDLFDRHVDTSTKIKIYAGMRIYHERAVSVEEVKEEFRINPLSNCSIRAIRDVKNQFLENMVKSQFS